MLPQQLKLDKVAEFSKNLPLYHTALNLVKWKVNDFDSRFIGGGTTERIVNDLLELSYNPEEIIWNEVKVYNQMYNGKDGIPDGGYDIALLDFKIDVKKDNQIKKGRVSLGLSNTLGSEGLLLSNKANVSAHVYIARRELSKVERHLNQNNKAGIIEFQCKVVYVDLDAIRKELKLNRGFYSIDGYFEEVLPSGDRAIRLDVSYLIQKGYARQDIYSY